MIEAATSATTSGAAGEPSAIAAKLASQTQPLKFGFRYLDKPFRATVTQREGTAHLTLHGHLGTLPFSAQSSAARAGVLRLLKAKGRGRLQLGPQLDITVHGDCDLPLPLTLSGILAGAVEILIESRGRILPLIEQLKLAAAQPAPEDANADAAEDADAAEPTSSEA
jgi:hypothetical protein